MDPPIARRIPLVEEPPVLEAPRSDEKKPLLYRSDIPKYRLNPIAFYASFASELIKHTLKEIKRNKLGFTFGMLACFLVVATVSALTTLLAYSPLVFLRLAESKAGQMDLRLRTTTGEPLNTTQVNRILSRTWDKNLEAFGTPRFETMVYLQKGTGCNFYEYRWQRASFFLMDFESEKKAGIGTRSKLPPLKRGEIFLSREVAKQLGVEEGDRVTLGINVPQFLGKAWRDAVKDISVPDLFCLPVVVNKTFENEGLYTQRIWGAILMELNEFLPFIAEQEGVPEEAQIEMKKTRLSDYASYILFNLPEKERMDLYLDYNSDAVKTKLTQTGSHIAYRLGFEDVYLEFPILEELEPLAMFKLFSVLIIDIIISILVLICTVLMYSLLVVNIQLRDFEIGIMRMTGMTKPQVLALLLFQSLSYIGIGFPLGLLFGELLIVGFFETLHTLLGLQIGRGGASLPTITPFSLFISVFLGSAVPLFASIFPIKTALSHSLVSSLDTAHSKVTAFHSELERTHLNQFDFRVFGFGLAFGFFGFALYFLIPFSIMHSNYVILLNLFVTILLFLFLGLSILSLNFQNWIEKFLTSSLLFWESSSILSLLRKNLLSHRKSNRKTFLLYSLSLAFVLFVTVSFHIQIETFSYRLQQKYGGLLSLEAWGNPDRTHFGHVRELEEFASSYPPILDYSWISVPLTSWSNNSAVSSWVSSLGHIHSSPVSIYAVSPNFFDVSLSKFLHTGTFSEIPGGEILHRLYSSEGYGSLILSSSMSQSLCLEPNSPYLLKIWEGQHLWNTQKTFSLGFLDSAPGFFMSKFPTSNQQDVLVSFPTYLNLSGGAIQSVDDIPLKNMVFKLAPHTSREQIDFIKQSLWQLNRGGMWIWDFDRELTSLRKVVSLLDYFFQLTTVVAVFICFFSLTSTMLSNIQDQAKEIGILRALGTSPFSLYRLYIWESFVLSCSGSIVGIFIGSFVAWTMTLQRELYTQLPLPFVFPWQIMLLTIASSLFFSSLASLSGVWYMLKKPITSIMKHH